MKCSGKNLNNKPNADRIVLNKKPASEVSWELLTKSPRGPACRHR